MLSAVIAALLGYATGTIQILILDWIRGCGLHRRQLRTLRAELQHALTITKPLDWDPRTGPKTDFMARAPNLSARFIDLVTQSHFYLTDEHDKDNTQESMTITQAADGKEYYDLAYTMSAK
jgi:hypothetical protein